jgi:hypothetical protein
MVPDRFAHSCFSSFHVCPRLMSLPTSLVIESSQAARSSLLFFIWIDWLVGRSDHDMSHVGFPSSDNAPINKVLAARPTRWWRLTRLLLPPLLLHAFPQ